jgi:hypothetical protein
MNGISCRLWLSALSTLIALAVMPTAQAQTPVPISPQLKVPADQTLLFKIAAKGTQIYVCQAPADHPKDFTWTLKAPQADLFQAETKVGRHYAGPTWEANDGSKIMGQVKVKVKAPQADAIPWLLLTAKSAGNKGMFAPVNWVQRLNTVGGQAPATGCDRSHQNQETAVGYSADYYFYGDSNTSYEY